MSDQQKKKWRNLLLHASKIGIGSSLAIYVAELMGLQYAIAAGSVALLTIVSTKWGTVKLSLARIVTFIISALFCGIIFTHVTSDWLAYGIFCFFVVVTCGAMGWLATVSVNALIGMHFLSFGSFTKEFIWNEFQLVLIGIVIAIILNLFHDYGRERKHLVKNMRYTEDRLKGILKEISAYLSNVEAHAGVWDDIKKLEDEIKAFIQDAEEYQDNTFQSHPGYYIDYFEMRLEQCRILARLHNEMTQISKVPFQVKRIVDYIDVLAEHVVEHNIPTVQMEELNDLIKRTRAASLPTSWYDLENRALFYHILKDLEDFLQCKQEFIDGLSEEQKRLYWKADEEDNTFVQ